MKSLLIVIASVLLSVSLMHFVGNRDARPSSAPAETTYDRVIRTKTIRCGYAVWPPYALSKDPNTGQLQGFLYDIVEQMGKNLGLKVEWAEEVPWGPQMAVGLNAGRYDLLCAAMWGTAEEAPYFTYSVPLNYSGTHFYARANDHRFDNDLSVLNDPKYTLSTADGEQSDVVARSFFPKAKTASLPQGAELSSLLLNVATGKADGVFLEPSLALEFARNNPGKIRQVTQAPYQIFPNMLAAKIGDDKFMTMLNNALVEMHNTGVITKIVNFHVKDKGIFMPLAKPYIYESPEALP